MTFRARRYATSRRDGPKAVRISSSARTPPGLIESHAANSRLDARQFPQKHRLAAKSRPSNRTATSFGYRACQFSALLSRRMMTAQVPVESSRSCACSRRRYFSGVIPEVALNARVKAVRAW